MNSQRARHPIFGIDASRAVTAAPTGTEYYSRALIRTLLQLATPFHFRLYTRTLPPANLFPLTNNYDVRVMPFPRLWTHLRLSYEMLTRPPDALFVPAHVLPPIHPRNSLVTVHDVGYKYFPATHSRLSRLYLDLSTRWNVRDARVVIADSRTTRDDIVKFYGAPVEKIRVVYPAYNTDVFKPIHDVGEIQRVRSKYALLSPYLISVGTVQPRKNYARLIEAAASLPNEYSLVIVGKKSEGFDALAVRVRELKMEARVKFLDYVPIDYLPALYAGAELAVFPSLYEGFGFPALEAQACETPLVCSNTSSLPEVAGEGAAYFGPLDTTDMANVIHHYLADSNARAALVEQGRANLERFSWERAAKDIVEIVMAL